jgi:prepilin-type N-terminal cleavage/methylation domain-containing protein
MAPRALTRARKRLADLNPCAQEGFTLIELLATMTMLGIGLTAAFFFYSAALGRTTDTQARIDTISDLRNVGEQIARDIRDSEKLCPPLPSPSSNQLYLSGPPVPGVASTSANVCATTRRIIWDCATTAGTCTRSEAGHSPVVAATGLSTSTPMFSSSGSNYILIHLYKLPAGREGAITFDRGASLRNYCVTAAVC